MEHVDPDVLALVALGEPAADDVARAHLATCGRCRAEVESLTGAVRVGRSSDAGEALVAPPAAVWGRIRDELGLSPALEPGSPVTDIPGSAGEQPATSSAPAAPARLSVVDGGAGHPAPEADAAPDHLAPGTDAARDDLAPVVPLRRRRAPWVAAAAAAGIVIGAAGGTVWAGRDGTPAPDVVAQAALDPLPGWEASGEAVVEVTPDGGRVLVLNVEGDGGADGYREVWLIDRDVTRLVSLGVLTGDEGRFTVPDGLDLTDFAVVDVSEEPFDGDPAHSGDSIVRGILDA